MAFAKKCDKYQRFTPMSKALPKELTIITSPWPFVIWGIDLIGQLPKGRGSVQYVVFAIDYFTKYVEADVLVSITPTKIKEFVYKNIIFRCGFPYTIVLDSGK